MYVTHYLNTITVTVTATCTSYANDGYVTNLFMYIYVFRCVCIYVCVYLQSYEFEVCSDRRKSAEIAAKLKK